MSRSLIAGLVVILLVWQFLGSSASSQVPIDLAFVENCQTEVCALETTPNDPFYTQQYGPQRIQAPLAWDVTTGSSTVKLAILDTGIDCLHEDISSKCLPGYDFISNVALTGAENSDDHGHGTHVTSIAAGVTNNGVGVAGLCWQCQYMPVKVLDSGGSGLWVQVASGIRFAADNGAHVINMSLGGSSSDSGVQDAVDYAYNRGVLVISACGNSFGSNCLYPAAFQNSMAISCTNSSDVLCDFSSIGQEVDVAAPGLSVIAAVPKGACNLCAPSGYRSLSGTSMSTPHVAGVAGLIRSIQPTLSVDRVWGLLEQSSDDKGNVGWDTSYGHGRLNAFKAVTQTAPSGRLPHNPQPQPPTNTPTLTSTPTNTPTPGPPTPTPTPKPPVTGTFFLHNNPSPPTFDTSIQAVLPMNNVPPSAPQMFNYASDKYSKPGAQGRFIQAAEVKENASDKLQIWVSSSFTANKQVDGTVELTIYAKLESGGKGLRARVRLAECSPSCVIFADAVSTEITETWPDLWYELEASFTVNRLLDAGNTLRLYVQLDKNMPNSDPGFLGYDAQLFEAKLVLP